MTAQRDIPPPPVMDGGAYVGASGRRTMMTWRAPLGSADSLSLPALPVLRDRALDLDRNNPAARGAVRTALTGAIGKGLTVRSSIDREVLGLSEEQAQAWQSDVEQEFRLWSESLCCDFMRQKNFLGLQRLAFLSQRTTGDCFVLMPWVKQPGIPYDLRIQLIEAHRVCNPDDAPDTAQIAGGIERNGDGVPVAIHVRTPHPGVGLLLSNRNLTPTWKRVPIYGGATGRRNVLHLLDVDRIGLTRGVPMLAPVIETLKQVGRYSDAELAAAVVNAMLSVAINRPLESPSGASIDWGEAYEARGELPPWEDQNRLQLGNGTWIDLAPGETLNIINAARPSNQFDAFFLANMKQIGMALNIPFEVLLKCFQSSYSASRAAMLAFEKAIAADRDDFEEAFCQPIYNEFLIEAVIKWRISAPGFLTDPAIRLAYSGAYWQGPAQGQIDEEKEVRAANMRVMYGFSTRTREAAKLSGMTFADIVKEQAEEKRVAGLYGVSFDINPVAGSATAGQQEGAGGQAAVQ